MERVLFTEKQRFRQWWLWSILIASFLVSTIPFIAGIYSQEVLDKPWGNNPASSEFLVFILLFDLALVGGIMAVVYKMRLVVEIRTTGLWYRFPLLSRRWKCIKAGEIEKYEIRTYRPVAEYGGWGIKGSIKNRAYNVSGNIGLQIYLKNGKKVLFGTQKQQAIAYAMERMMNRERID